MSNSSPVHFGKGSCKVSVYSPTQSLPYYRLCYRVGGRRYQHTRKTYDEAEEAAQAIQIRFVGWEGIFDTDYATRGSCSRRGAH